MPLLVDDRDLLDAFRHGERTALERVFRHYAPDLSRTLAQGFTVGGSAGHAHFPGYRSRFDLEDALHEVFLRAFSERARFAYDGLTPFRNYLLGIARGVVIDHWRRIGRRERLVGNAADGGREEPATTAAETGTEPLEGLLDATGNPERDLADAELVREVVRFRAELSAEEREIFRLRFQEGRSLAEVEAETGRSPSKVKTLERRLRARILERIWRSGYLEAGCSGKKRGWIARLLGSREGLGET